MKSILALAAASLLTACVAAPADETSPVSQLGDTVRVGLVSTVGYVDSFTFTCDTEYALVDPSTGELRRISASGAKCRIRARELDRPQAGVSFQARIRPLRSSGVIVIEEPESSYRRFRGSLEVGITASGKLLLVNELPMEEYLRGVVPAEVPPQFAAEAVKAQAIAARTYAENRRGGHGRLGFDLCDSTHCQVYRGADKETDKTDEAISATRGQIMTNDKKPICAMYHSNSGGRTESAEAIGKEDALPYLASVDDDQYCSEMPNYTWNAKLSQRELGRKLSSRAGADLGYIRSVEIGARNASGRIRELDIKGTRGSRTLSGPAFREACGYTVIKSTNFTVAKDGGDFVFTGRGYGHGLGLSQWGAHGMASPPHNKKAADILKHYYKGVQIEAAGPTGSTVVGRLTDAITDKPIKGARVEAVGYDGWSVETDKRGRFALGGLPAGKVDLRISKPGYEALSIWALELKTGAILSIAKELRRD